MVIGIHNFTKLNSFSKDAYVIRIKTLTNFLLKALQKGLEDLNYQFCSTKLLNIILLLILENHIL